jgi:TPP-dependent pyruvate/acetoin dehydrogenase alpha subunit
MSGSQPATALRLYRTMQLIAQFDAAADAAARQGDFAGGYSATRGQEAVSAAVCLALEERDVLYPGLHGIGEVLARGSEPRLVMAEVFGKATGLNGGKGGRLHVADAQRNTMPINGILGASLPLAAGSAFGAKLRQDGVVTICFVGDRAAEEGIFHETLNFIALWQLPILLVAVNNAPVDASSPLSEHISVQTMADLARVYGIDTATIDGTDAIAVYGEVRSLLQRLRTSQTPFFLECLTYPLDEASRDETLQILDEIEAAGGAPSSSELRRRVSDILVQRPAEWWRQRDPLKKLEFAISDRGVARDDELAAIRDEVQAVVQDALAFARQSPEPPLAAALDGVYRC